MKDHAGLASANSLKLYSYIAGRMDAPSKSASLRVANLSVLYTTFVFAAYTTSFANVQKLNSYITRRIAAASKRAYLKVANLTVLYRSMCVNNLHDIFQRPLENLFAYNTAEARTQIEDVSERSKSHRTI